MSKTKSVKKCANCGIRKELLKGFIFNKRSDKYTDKCRDCLSPSYIARLPAHPTNTLKKEANNSYYHNNKERIQKNRSEKYVGDMDYRIKHIMRNAKQRSRKKGLEFNLTYNYLKNLLLSQDCKCALTRVPLILGTRDNKEQSLSLDRIDPNEGYIEGNVQWTTIQVNFMKTDLTMDELKRLCKKILEVVDE